MKQFKFFQKKSIIFEPLSDIPEWYEVYHVSPIMYDPTTFDAVKCVMYLDTVTQRIVKGETISEGHPLWNYERV